MTCYLIVLQNSYLLVFFQIPRSPSSAADMEWLQMNPGGNPMTTTVEVDIGYIPEMEISLARPTSMKEKKWSREISMKKAFTLVERHLYPFKKVSLM